MTYSTVVLNMICEPSVERDIEIALKNSGVQYSKEQISDNNFVFYIPTHYWSLSLVIQILRSKINVLEGSIKFSDGKIFELTTESLQKFENDIVEDMFKEKEIIPVHTEVRGVETKTLLDYTPEQWSEFITKFGEVWMKVKTAGSVEKKHLAYPIYGLITLILFGFFYLANQKLIDGQSVTFIFGILIGALIPFLREFIIPEQAT